MLPDGWDRIRTESITRVAIAQTLTRTLLWPCDHGFIISVNFPPVSDCNQRKLCHYEVFT